MGHERTSGQEGSDDVLSHILQLDHWTFLLALCLVTVNVAINSRFVSAAAACLLVVALVYDVCEFYAAQ